MNVLSEAGIGAWRADGVVAPEFRLPPDGLECLQSLAARLIADSPHMGDEPIASPHVPGSGVHEPDLRDGATVATVTGRRDGRRGR